MKLYKKFRRKLTTKRDLIGKVIESDLTSFSDYLNQPHSDSYTATGSKTQAILKEPPVCEDIPGEYFETDPEIIDVAFSHQGILNTRELLDRGVCTQIIGKQKKQEGYRQLIYHRPYGKI